MRGNSIGYLIKEGFKNIKINSMMSLASIGIMIACLLLTGAAVLFSVNVTNIVRDLQGENIVNVYLKQDTSEADSKALETTLVAMPNISTVVFVPKQEALNKYNEMLDGVFSDITPEENFLPDAYKITMKDLSLYDQTIEQIRQIQIVDTINDKSDSAQKLSSLNMIVTIVGFWIVVVLAVMSFFIVSNTIRVTMHARRLEINIMKSVGATNWFIRLPFLIEGIVLGLLSSIISIILLKVIYDNIVIALNHILIFNSVPFSSLAPYLTFGFLLIGVVFGSLGGMVSITRYLSKEGENIIN
ncbi:MAG: permease-like cell division protein FtsX [Clostridia bacterium]|nr:permease-like cell division protein FtsX [Clostridia bacterium]